jgi:hypothetical protein
MRANSYSYSGLNLRQNSGVVSRNVKENLRWLTTAECYEMGKHSPMDFCYFNIPNNIEIYLTKTLPMLQRDLYSLPQNFIRQKQQSSDSDKDSTSQMRVWI